MPRTGVPAAIAGYTPVLPPWDTTTLHLAAVSLSGSRSATYVAVAVAGISLLEVASTTETDSLCKARRSAGKARTAPELPKAMRALGFGSSSMRFHQSGLGMGGAHWHMPT